MAQFTVSISTASSESSIPSSIKGGQKTFEVESIQVNPPSGSDPTTRYPASTDLGTAAGTAAPTRRTLLLLHCAKNKSLFGRVPALPKTAPALAPQMERFLWWSWSRFRKYLAKQLHLLD